MFLLVFFLCSCLSSSYVLTCLLLTFLLIFFLHSHSSSSYVLACLLLTFLLAFFLHSCLPSSYVLARRTFSQAHCEHLPQAIYLAELNQQTHHQAVWGSLPGRHS